MIRNLLALATLVTSLVTAASAAAQEVQYWGPWPGTERGLIRFQDQYYTVGTGDDIPGVGTVQRVTSETLVVRRMLTEGERHGLAEQGRVVPEAETRRIPNLANRVRPPLMRGVPGPLR